MNFKVVFFTRQVALQELVAENAATKLYGINFSLNDLPNYSEFTALFDVYKINAVKLQFIPQQTQSVSLGSINNPDNVRFFSAIDYTDDSAPSSVDELRQYATVKCTSIFKTHTRYINKPKILDSVSSSRSPWISTSSPSTNYYGLKVAIEPMDSSTTLAMSFQGEAKYYFAFKNVK